MTSQQSAPQQSVLQQPVLQKPALQQLAIFGATGSIGASTLDVLKANPGHYQLAAISGHNNVTRLAQLAQQWQPRWLVLTNTQHYQQLLEELDDFHGEILCGEGALVDLVASNAIDKVVAAVSGVAGLASCYQTLVYGKTLLLANKEPMIAAGDLMLTAAEKGGGRIIPVDSEHSGAWQCLGCPDIPLYNRVDIRRMILTASGGPFRDWQAEKIAHATVEQACQHPNWSMGRKISVDSASMMNKGLELIEAHKLFQIPAQALDVVVHRESLVHAMVEWHDGSLLAQVSQTSMKVPLAKALGFPGFLSSDTPPLDITALSGLTFEVPDIRRYPCLLLAQKALQMGGDAPLRLNAANEEVVQAFLEGRVIFGDIPRVIERSLESSSHVLSLSIDDVLQLDQEVRTETRESIEELCV